MASPHKRSRLKRWALYGGLFLIFLLGFLSLVAERFVVPVLKSRLHTLIIQGSDSLYQYRLGGLEASFLGGNIEIDDFHIAVDSNRYRQLEVKNDLPSMIMQVDMDHGHMKGLGVFTLLFGKKISISEIFSKDARIVLIRSKNDDTVRRIRPPLWKAIQPAIRTIAIGKIELAGIRLLYRTADTSQSVQLKFDTCNAVFRNIRIDSAAAKEEDRIGFAKEIALHFYDLKFRSADSTFKLKAKVIDYSSKDRRLEVQDFKLQPTLKEKEDFYRAFAAQKSMMVIEYDKMSFTNFRVEEFFHRNAIVADSLLIDRPLISLYMDKTQPPLLEGKLGQYPHQKLLNAGVKIGIGGIGVRNLNLTYTERGEKSREEGTLTLHNVDIGISNVTNIPSAIRRNNRCVAQMKGTLLGKSPLDARFTFFLDSAEGQFEAAGTIRNVTAAQLNGLAEPLSNTRLQSLNLHLLEFSVKGDDYSTTGDIRMRYDNLFLLLQKTDDASGSVSTKKFLTKLLNKYTLQRSNPGPDGRERVATNIVRARLLTQSFFGLVWKTIFTGMQTIMTVH